MTIDIKPFKPVGKVTVPPSKSMAHRAIICAALARGTSLILNIALSEDIKATIDCATAMGAKCKYDDKSQALMVIGGLGKPTATLDAGESGSTLRFFIPLALLHGGASFVGRGRLLDRPLSTYTDCLPELKLSRSNNRLDVSGSLSAGDFALDGGVSSQFVSGLLFALPLLEQASTIKLIGKLESAPYIALTIQCLRSFGIAISHSPDLRSFSIDGGQRASARTYQVEGDWSQAAFWYVANALGGEIEINGLANLSTQGDRKITSLVSRLPDTIDASDIPDLVPILSVLLALTEGERAIVGASRLRIKESDRLNAMATELAKLGANVTERADGLFIRGVPSLGGGTVCAHNDHRIAMALAIGATRASDTVTIEGAECVAKSYPDFFEVLDSLKGGQR